MAHINSLITLLMAAIMIAPPVSATEEHVEEVENTESASVSSTPTNFVTVLTANGGGGFSTVLEAVESPATTIYQAITIYVTPTSSSSSSSSGGGPMSTMYYNVPGGYGTGFSTGVIDTRIPMRPHTCPLDALAAGSKWRKYCLEDWGRNLPPVYCSRGEPSIERCCGDWVFPSTTRWVNYPGYHELRINRTTGAEYWAPKLTDERREIVKLRWDEFYWQSSPCKQHRPDNDAEFWYFTQNLERDFGYNETYEAMKLGAGKYTLDDTDI